MKLLSEQKALERLSALKLNFQSEIANSFEHRAKSCLTCETQGACCLDAHFVNVHISRLEAVAITKAIREMPLEKRDEIYERIDTTITRYGLASGADSFAKTYACPMFEKGVGCLIHNIGKPVPCITHACYENAHDLPPDELQSEQEVRIDRLNSQTYGKPQPLLSLPVALSLERKISYLHHK